MRSARVLGHPQLPESQSGAMDGLKIVAVLFFDHFSKVDYV